MSHKVSVLDFGSGKISVFVGERGLNNTIRVSGMGVCEYPGFYNGKILSQDKLADTLSVAISTAEDCAGQKIESLLVGVPADFCVNVCKSLTLNFKNRHKITEYDVQDLYGTCSDFDDIGDEYEVINVNPVYFMLDNERRLMNPEGHSSVSLNALVSFTLAQRGFTDFIRSLIEGIGVKQVEFTSSMLAEILELFPSEKRDLGVVLVDVGFSTTNVAVAKGDGILCLKSFSVGGANITADLATYFEIPFKQAEKLKKKVNLSLMPSIGENYEYEYKGKVCTNDAKVANEIVTERIKSIARGVEKCVAMCSYDFPEYLPYSITGGGVSYIRGVKDVMCGVLGKKIEIVTPDMPLAQRPNLSTVWGLMNMAINTGFGKKSLFDKIFKKG